MDLFERSAVKGYQYLLAKVPYLGKVPKRAKRAETILHRSAGAGTFKRYIHS